MLPARGCGRTLPRLGRRARLGLHLDLSGARFPRLPRPRRHHARAAAGDRGDGGRDGARGQPLLAAHLRPARPPGRRGVPRVDRRGAGRAARPRCCSPPAAPSPTTSRSRASSTPAATPTRAGSASWSARSSTTPSWTACDFLVGHEGAEVTWLEVDRAGPRATRTVRAAIEADPTSVALVTRDVGQQRGRHGAARRRGRRRGPRARHPGAHRRRPGRRSAAGRLRRLRRRPAHAQRPQDRRAARHRRPAGPARRHAACR